MVEMEAWNNERRNQAATSSDTLKNSPFWIHFERLLEEEAEASAHLTPEPTNELDATATTTAAPEPTNELNTPAATTSASEPTNELNETAATPPISEWKKRFDEYMARNMAPEIIKDLDETALKVRAQMLESVWGQTPKN
jgi:hypothetical protein